jgi:toxin FitB
VIILDTNVLSEAMRQAPSPIVTKWLDTQTIESMCTTAVTIAELAAGIDMLPAGKKRTTLLEKFTALRTALKPRILPLDEAAGLKFGQVIAKAKKAGYGIGIADAQIAAIALTTGYTVATRDTAPFEAVGVKVLNPWGLV